MQAVDIAGSTDGGGGIYLKLFQKHRDASKLHKAEEIRGVMLPRERGVAASIGARQRIVQQPVVFIATTQMPRILGKF
jgi:hypothetical protein